jgi:hypothetical protein
MRNSGGGGIIMTTTEPVWAACLSPTLSDDLLSCIECRAFEFPKCDGCPVSSCPILGGEPKDPMNSIKVSRWIDSLIPLVRGRSLVATTPLSMPPAVNIVL